MQCNYVHAVDACKGKSSRSVLIFRQGRAVQLSTDTGTRSSTLPPERPDTTCFGHPKAGVVEGSKLYSRKELYHTFTHRLVMHRLTSNFSLRYVRT